LPGHVFFRLPGFSVLKSLGTRISLLSNFWCPNFLLPKLFGHESRLATENFRDQIISTFFVTEKTRNSTSTNSSYSHEKVEIFKSSLMRKVHGALLLAAINVHVSDRMAAS
jgi:hypothetical protein